MNPQRCPERRRTPDFDSWSELLEAFAGVRVIAIVGNESFD